MALELSKVPTLDLNKFNNGNLDEQKQFVSEIGNSFNQIKNMNYNCQKVLIYA